MCTRMEAGVGEVTPRPFSGTLVFSIATKGQQGPVNFAGGLTGGWVESKLAKGRRQAQKDGPQPTASIARVTRAYGHPIISHEAVPPRLTSSEC